ncbi:MAG TPA: hypothetical protein VFX74_09640, partial [Candidatus Limnocylindria bacterium]|nr:hypothetical protein [Candidatus Limnocylindria bacterium]
MPDETISIARVPLARAARRLLAAPLIAMLLGVGTGVAAVLVGGWAGIALGLAGVATFALGLWLWLILLTIRLDVEVSSIHLHWLGGERRYALVRGPVTRVALTGPKAVPLRAWFGAFGWTIGRARLRGEERIQIVRLAPTDSLILVPTEGIRLAVAPRSESDLIAALTAAARVQHRLDAARPRLPIPVAPTAVTPTVVEPTAAEPNEHFAPRVLTGIERVELEERLAAQRAAALATAEEERQAQAARAAGGVVAPAAAAVARTSRPQRRVPSLVRPAWTQPSLAMLSGLAVLLLPLIATSLVMALA